MGKIGSGIQTDIIIVGAGMSGLLAANKLSASGYRVMVFDKSAGLGGRLATRRADEAVFDHGAQYFTARDPVFRAIVQDLLEKKIVRSWATGFALTDGSLKEDGDERFCGVTGMTAIAKHLSQGLEILLGTKIMRLDADGSGWKVTTETHEVFKSRGLLLTPPVPQSLQLLSAGTVRLPEQVKTDLEQIEYAPCLALLVQLSGTSLVPDPGGLWLRGGPISWIADNHRKGISPGDKAALTIHASPDYSSQQWDSPESVITETLLRAAAPWLGSKPLRTQLHRWRYSIPTHVHSQRCVTLTEPAPIVFAGDAFGGPRVEGAALSGLAAAESLIEMLSR